MAVSIKRIIGLLSLILFRTTRILMQIRRAKRSKVVILSYHKLGDTIFLLPSIRALTKHYGERNILIATYEHNVPVFNLEFSGMSYLTATKSDFVGYREFPRCKVIRQIRKVNPEVIIDLSTGTKPAIMALFSGARLIFGANSIVYRGIYNGYIPHKFDCHVREIYPKIISTIPGIRIDQDSGPVKKNNGRYILVHPTAAWRAKEWGMGNYYKLCANLKKDYTVKLISEYGTVAPEVINDFKTAGIEFILTKNISDLIDAIKKCYLFIGNDSGPLYLANYLQKPTFTIYGPTNPSYHLPYEGVNAFSQEIINCSPVNTKMCYLDGGRKCSHFSCMAQLSEEKVYSDLSGFISREKIFSVKDADSNN